MYHDLDIQTLADKCAAYSTNNFCLDKIGRKVLLPMSMEHAV